MNRRFVCADLMIYVGNVGPGGFRTYTGTGAVIGLASTRSIASHHSFHGIRALGLSAGDASRRPRHSVKDDLNTQMEIATGKQVFYINSDRYPGPAIVEERESTARRAAETRVAELEARLRDLEDGMSP